MPVKEGLRHFVTSKCLLLSGSCPSANRLSSFSAAGQFRGLPERGVSPAVEAWKEG